MQAINKERVAGLLQGLAQFGKTEHGITRLAYTAEDKAAQEWLLKQIQDLQLKLSVDAVGNVFLRRDTLLFLPDEIPDNGNDNGK